MLDNLTDDERQALIAAARKARWLMIPRRSLRP